MRVSVTCKHGVTRTATADAKDWNMGIVTRSLVLSCPECWHEAGSWVNYPSRWALTGEDDVHAVR